MSAVAYLDYIGQVVRKAEKESECASWWMLGECKNHHRYGRVICCEKEWCPDCGKIGSGFHMRKYSRWIPKIEEFAHMGYFVFTMPKEIRAMYRSKVLLSWLCKRVTNGDKSDHIEGLLKGLGFERGLSRWHFFGDKGGGIYNPHLNVLVEGKRIGKELLKTIRLAWARILGVKVAVVNYQYTHKPGKMLHILRYIVRATFRDRNWDNELADRLYGFRNMRSWGKWGLEKMWHIQSKTKEKVIEVVQLEKSVCPECGERVVWGKGGDIDTLRMMEADGVAYAIEGDYYKLVNFVDLCHPKIIIEKGGDG